MKLLDTNPTSIGQAAETAVADKLKNDGFKILDRNWKTKVCEIDIVAKKNNVIYFVEVKYRSGSAQGDGFEYVGPQKLKRLLFAAEIWVQNQRWSGDYRILAAAATTDGREIKVIDFVEIE